MKVTLEKADLVNILSRALGYPIDESDVEVQADPFEVHIRQVDVSELAKQTETAETVEDPIETPETSTVERREPVLTMTDILAQNEAMGGAPRPLGPQETEDPPPITEEELAVGRRYRE